MWENYEFDLEGNHYIMPVLFKVVYITDRDSPPLSLKIPIKIGKLKKIKKEKLYEGGYNLEVDKI